MIYIHSMSLSQLLGITKALSWLVFSVDMKMGPNWSWELPCFFPHQSK